MGTRIRFSTRIFKDALMHFISDFESSKNAIAHATYWVGNIETFVKSCTIWAKGKNVARINWFAWWRKTLLPNPTNNNLQPTRNSATLRCLTYGGAKSVDCKIGQVDRGTLIGYGPPGGNDERIIGQEKNTKYIFKSFKICVNYTIKSNNNNLNKSAKMA